METGIGKLNRTIGATSLIIVPLFFTLSEVFHPITMSTPMEEIASAADHFRNWTIAHLLALVSLAFIPFLALKLETYIDRKYGSLFSVFYAASMLGLVATVGLLVFDFVIMGMGRIGPLPEFERLYVVLELSIFGVIFLKLGPLLFLTGLLGLIVLMLMTGSNNKLPVVLILVGLLIYGLTGPLIPIPNAHILVSAGSLLMLIGFILKTVERNDGQRVS